MSNQSNDKIKIVDDFIASVLVLFDNIKIPAANPNKTINIMTTSIQKQYLTYYVYRIWIKYRSSIENAVSKNSFLYILELLNIPSKYHKIYITYPMVNKMPSNEKILDLVLFQMLQQLHKSSEIYARQPGGTGDFIEFNHLVDYLIGKTVENIIQDILQIKMLLPNLARPSEDFFSWEKVLPLADTYEAATDLANGGLDVSPELPLQESSNNSATSSANSAAAAANTTAAAANTTTPAAQAS